MLCYEYVVDLFPEKEFDENAVYYIQNDHIYDEQFMVEYGESYPIKEDKYAGRPIIEEVGEDEVIEILKASNIHIDKEKLSSLSGG